MIVGRPLVCLFGLCILFPAFAAEPSLEQQARNSLRSGVEFFRREVAIEGSYVWQCSDDLSKREGEGKIVGKRGWVQPPGTPAVGLALLAAHKATGDSYYLEAAREAAQALMRGQLKSGGWTYSIEFEPAERRRFAYRDGDNAKGRNVTTFDDSTTQTAVRFLMKLDEALGGRDEKVREAATFALESILKAQYPNGAWPQGYEGFPDAEKFPVKKALYPPTWPREWPGSGQYWLRYTLNDNALPELIALMLDVPAIYGGLAERCRASAEKAGDFLLLAQMPDPQPGWAQQYDFDMHPAWARKFEPPAISGGESQGAIRALLMLQRTTRQRKYLEPIPRALAYLERSRLPGGKLARFYELKTNKPLYFTKSYELTYSNEDVPTHYAFEVPDNTQAIQREYEGTSEATTEPKNLERNVKRIIEAQDERGRWVENGRLRYHGPNDPTTRVIRSATFVRNVETLSSYLKRD